MQRSSKQFPEARSATSKLLRNMNQLSADSTNLRKERAKLRAKVMQLYKRKDSEAWDLKHRIDEVVGPEIVTAYDKGYRHDSEGKLHAYYRMLTLQISFLAYPVLRTQVDIK